MTEVRLPELAESMTSAIITTWLRREGEFVESGEPLVEVDIDKTTVELEAPTSGVLTEIKVPDGTEDVPVGTVLALIDDQATRPDAPDPFPDREAGSPGGQGTAIASAPVPSPGVAVSPASIDASPLARRMAELAGLDLSSVEGSGPAGRIRKADLERLLR